MTVKLTSPVMGLETGEPYEGPCESWLVNHGYAVAEDGTDIEPLSAANDLTLADVADALTVPAPVEEVPTPPAADSTTPPAAQEPAASE